MKTADDAEGEGRRQYKTEQVTLKSRGGLMAGTFTHWMVVEEALASVHPETPIVLN
jgi:hypothetical protein